MKTKSIFILAVTLFLAGCQKAFFQLHETTQYINNQPTEAISIFYDFWAPDGRMAFTIKNNTDKIITIHTEKCFFVLNEISNCYYTGQTVTTGANLNVSKSIINPWNSKTVILSGGAGIMASSTIQQEKTTRIAPRASHPFNSYNISGKRFYHKDLKPNPKKSEVAQLNFNADNSPIKFSNVITFSVEGDEKQYLVEHGFYVKTISNFIEKAFMKSDLKWPENLNSTSYYTEYANALSFYIVYYEY